MIKQFLREWLGVASDWRMNCQNFVDNGVLYDRQIHLLQNEIRELRVEVTRLSIAQYVPPSQPETERKIIKTNNFKQFQDIIQREFEAEEARQDAV